MKNNFFKHLFTALLLLCSTAVFAATVVVDGITYDVVTKAKVATVIAGETKYAGNVVIPEAFEYDGATYSVISVGKFSFYDCTGLTNIEIPNSVTSIKERAFYNCGLTSVTIPNSVTSIENGVFENCRALTSVTIPASVTSIGIYTFFNCPNINEVHISDLTAWCNIDFEYINSNPLCQTAEIYLNGKVVTDLVIPDGITEIKENAFCGCSLASIEIPNSVTSIGEQAFSYCSSLTSIKIPNSVTSIGDMAFSDCSGLTSIEIPNSVTSIAENAFVRCSGLKRVELDCVNIASWFSGNADLETVVIGNSVISIETGAFAGCEELLDVYCFASTVPATATDAFDGSYPEYINLHVPTEALENYRSTMPWSTFGNIIPFGFDLAVSTVGYATLYLDYAVEIPTGVEVYTANAVEGEFLKMQLVEGVIPANTGVIVKADAGTYTFTGAIDNPSPIAGNLFKGSVENKMVKVPSSSQAYVLSIVDGEVGMYRAQLTDGYFLNNANKAYLLLGGNNLDIYDEEFDTSAGGQLSNGYRFDFGGITGIDEVKGENGEVKTIYDLQGRKVEIPSKGIYIIDGKKVLVK